MKKAFTGFLSCFFALSVIFTSLVFAPVSAEGSGGVKFGVMSDLHFHDGTTGIDSNIYTMLNYYKEQNVDAILVLGDVANSAKETQFAKFTTAWDSVFTDAESADKKIPACDFNHDGKLDGSDLINMRKKLLKTV